MDDVRIIVSNPSQLREEVTRAVNLEFRRLINQDAVMWYRSKNKKPKKNVGVIGGNGQFLYWNEVLWMAFDRMLGEIQTDEPEFWANVPVYSNKV